MFVGGFLGFAVYCSLVMLKELPHLIFRGYYDWESVVKEFFSPLAVVLIFSKDARSYTPWEVFFQSTVGAILVITGICVGAWKGSSQESQAD